MSNNNFLPFAPTDTGTNLLSQADYSVATQRIDGNQPGVASSKLVNKALRQSSYIASQYAQFLSNQLTADVLDDATPAELLAQINAVFFKHVPVINRFTSSTGTWNKTYKFQIVTGSATVGATYTNNGFTYTVKTTVSSGIILETTGTGDPSVSGTLTKATGTGDATLTFYAYRAALYLRVRMIGAGGGGAGNSTTGSNNGGLGGTGGSTTFGTSLLTAAGGSGGPVGRTNIGGVGGAPTVTSPAVAVISIAGGTGSSTQETNGTSGINPNSGSGGQGFFGGASGGAPVTFAGTAGITNSGGGGSGAGTIGTGVASYSGAGGGAGAYIEAIIPSPSATYAYAVGAAGAAGAAGTSGVTGGTGGSGVIIVEECYQ